MAVGIAIGHANEWSQRVRREWLRRPWIARIGLLGLALLAGAAADPAPAFSPAEIYRNAAESVVLIFGFDDGGQGSSGTGSVIARDGLVLTNNHVITDPESGRVYPNLVVYFKPQPISGDNRKDLTDPHLVDVVARDPDLDLALLRVQDAPAGLRPIAIGDSEEVDIGEPVAAIGHPGGGGLWTLTTGTVSSKRKDKQRDIFQTDTAINPGNSGGPLLDENARLIGVNTFVRRVNDQGLPLEGLNYSLRSALALAWVNRQGVARISPVERRASAAAVVQPARPEPTAAAENEDVPEPAESKPEPPLAHPEPPPTPSPPARAKPEPPPRAEAPPEPKAREFEGPNGEKLYGVPNPDADLHETLRYAREGFRKLIERADKSVHEMDELFEDYDNF